MHASPLLWIVLAGTLIAPQEKATVGDFARSPTEHIINRIDQPFVVQSVEGIINRPTVGQEEGLSNALLEIQGPGAHRKIRRARTDESGRFKIGRVPAGTYRFKATLNGFQSVMGTVTVSKEAPRTSLIKITMLVGV